VVDRECRRRDHSCRRHSVLRSFAHQEVSQGLGTMKNAQSRFFSWSSSTKRLVVRASALWGSHHRAAEDAKTPPSRVPWKEVPAQGWTPMWTAAPHIESGEQPALRSPAVLPGKAALWKRDERWSRVAPGTSRGPSGRRRVPYASLNGGGSAPHGRPRQ